jgi:hypothetical protein
MEEIEETAAIDGIQRRTFKSQGVNVSWKYHPDRGLEIMWSYCD